MTSLCASNYNAPTQFVVTGANATARPHQDAAGIARELPEATTLGVSDPATLSQAVAVLDAYALEAVS